MDFLRWWICTKISKCFIDVDSVAWQQADDSQRAALKRKASNLIIIVDQFEEFFTNPENYHHGIPSRDSNLVLNVLLETARIALEEDFPSTSYSRCVPITSDSVRPFVRCRNILASHNFLYHA